MEVVVKPVCDTQILWGEWPPLVVTYWIDDLLTPFACTLRSIAFRFHITKCGTTWSYHIPFCPEVKGMHMPSFERLKIKEGETKGNPQKFQEFPNHFWLIS